MSKALVVLSGGQDSTTCLFWAIDWLGAENVHAISFDYGQRHAIELDSARFIAAMAGVKLEVVDIKRLLQSTSPLTSATELDKYENFDAMAKEVGDKVEKTFVPMRNSLFLTIAMNRAVALGCSGIVTGICGEDNANYPDCTNKFRRKLELALNQSLSVETPYVRILAPLMHLSKAESVDLAVTLPGCMEALAHSHTSYDGKYPPTDMNHSNILRAHGFEEAGIPDPLVVRAWKEGLMDLPATANYDVIRNG